MLDSLTSRIYTKTIQTRKERVNLVYAVKISVPNDGSLKIGMPGEAIFFSEKNEMKPFVEIEKISRQFGDITALYQVSLL